MWARHSRKATGYGVVFLVGLSAHVQYTVLSTVLNQVYVSIADKVKKEYDFCF